VDANLLALQFGDNNIVLGCSLAIDPSNPANFKEQAM
jgi:hypothetical protein